MNQTTKTVFITGASRGIGRAIAIRFAAAGYRLALCCRHNSDMLRKLQTLITEQYHTDCLIYTADTGNYSQMASMLNDTIQHFHHIDVLVNNAGISYIGLLTDMSSEDWQNILSTNLTSVFNSCRLTVPGMVPKRFFTAPVYRVMPWVFSLGRSMTTSALWVKAVCVSCLARTP